MNLTENLEGGRMGNGQRKNCILVQIRIYIFFFCEISRGGVAQCCICGLAVISKLLHFWPAHVRSTESAEILMLMPQSLDTYIKEILLHHCVEDEGDEEIEDDCGTVLPSVMVKCHISL